MENFFTNTVVTTVPTLPFDFSTGGVSSISTRGFLFGGSGESGESFIISASANSSFPRSKIPFNLSEGQKIKLKVLNLTGSIIKLDFANWF